MDKKIEVIERIEFLYADGVRKDETREQGLINLANMRFSPFIERFNKNKVIVKYFLKSEDAQEVSLENIDEKLKIEAIKYHQSFLHL